MFEKVRDIIAEQLGIEAGDIKMESSFVDDWEQTLWISWS